MLYKVFLIHIAQGPHFLPLQQANTWSLAESLKAWLTQTGVFLYIFGTFSYDLI